MTDSRRATPCAALLLLLAAACMPPAAATPRESSAPTSVRIRALGAASDSAGTLVRLTPDSLYWRSASTAAAPVHALPLTALARVAVGERLSQRDAFRRGMVRGALVGAGFGVALLAARHDAVGGAVGATAATAWLAGVIAGQQTESPQPPLRWRVVHPRGP